MASRTLLRFFNVSPGYCSGDLFYAFTSRPTMHPLRIHHQYKHVRGFRSERYKTKRMETSSLSVTSNGSVSNLRILLKPFCFAVTFSSVSIATAIIMEYERVRMNIKKSFNRSWGSVYKRGWRMKMERWWQNLYEGQRAFAPICFVNVLVFCAWRIPRLQQAMWKYFLMHPKTSAPCWPMVLSVFSHQSPLHLFANMYVLHSFSLTAVNDLGKEQFFALYLVSGVMGSFVSCVYKVAFAVTGPSLGASGAVLGILGYICTKHPDLPIVIIFLPMFPFAASSALKLMASFDIAGLIFHWKFLDHAAHLGGVAIGILWQKWGNLYIWRKRQSLTTLWHKLRGPLKSD